MKPHLQALISGAALVLIMSTVLAAPAAAQADNATNSSNETGGDQSLVDIDLVGALKEALFAPFQALAEVLVDVLTHAFTSYPQVQSNGEVAELHSLSLRITFAAAGFVVAAAGVLYMTGPVFGISYSQIRVLLPRIVVALMFGAVSTTLLQYAVDLSEATALAFKPGDPTFTSVLRLTGELVLVWVLKATLLISLVLVFIVRDFYILFAASVAPLIALGWSFPYAKRYADSLIGGFWAALLIGPVEMALFRLTLSLLETQGWEVPHWLLSSAGLLVMIWMPYQMYQASQAAGRGFRRLMRGARQKVRNERHRQQRVNHRDFDESEPGKQDQRSQQRRSTDDDYIWDGGRR